MTAKVSRTHIRVGHDVTVAVAELYLLVFSTLNGARRKAVEVVDFEVVLFREATFSLLDAHVARFFVVLDVFYSQKASADEGRKSDTSETGN
jgi:hypothetical protein